MLVRAAREEAREQRGRLKVFFGALPGVGKTCAMLAAARELRTAGHDVVVGWVETHGRAETARLAEGLEHLAPRTSELRGVALAEFDLDAALARRPELLLLDELAHTNAPGSRHVRRWQDVEELRSAGIDVWTTLNVQHVESLNDVVAGITGITVRETVPDALLDAADEIELVDLPPDELIQRLREGKVYVPEQAALAERNFFQKGNVIALRELALRRATQRVEAQAEEYRREHGIVETWRTQERLLVAFEHSPSSADLLRAARRMAEALHAPLIALTVEDPRFERLPEARREALSENIALAQRLGAETLVVRGDDAAAQVLSVARERGITRILVGRPRRPRWRSVFRPSRTERIVRSAGAIDVLVTAGETERGVERLRAVPPPPRQLAREHALALAAVCAPTLVCAVTTQLFSFTDQAMIYLLGVLFVSSRLTRGPALVNALASVAALDFFFVDPAWTLAVSDLRYVVTFGVMFAVALAVSHRTVIMREQADLARERERRAASLFVMSRDFGRARTAQEVAEIATGHVRAVLDREAVLLAWRGPGRLERLAGAAFDPAVQTRDAAVAAWVAEYGEPAGRGTDTLPASSFLFLPLAGVKASRGVLGIANADDARELSPSQRQLVESFAAQTALALERIELEAEAARARLTAETERTRSTLLSSVGHDLRIPLSAIGGAAQVLLDESRPIGADDRRELLGTIQAEGERLARLVTNLLDLTRLESGVLAPKKEWCPVDEILASARGRLRERIGARAVTLDVPEIVLEVHGDPALLEQALVNLFDNALKHTPAGSPLTLCARRDGDNVVLGVWDRGPGLSVGDETRVFERFYRSADAHGVEGTGLGLAVVDAIARTHGGTARARARDGGGACFELVIPGARESATEEGARAS